MRLTDIQLGYVAGMIDGEGCIHISYTNPSSRKHVFTVRISIHNSDKNVMNYLQSILGGYVQYRNRDPKGIHNWKDAYTWSVTQQQAKQLLLLVREHLVIKKRQADLALEMLATFLRVDNNVYGVNGIPYWLIEKRISLKNKMHELNKKGRSITNKGVNSEKPLSKDEVTPNQAEKNLFSLACVETKGHPPKGMI